MEAAMGETGDGCKEGSDSSVNKGGDVRVNGEMNGSCEEDMEVCESIPQHDTIVTKSLMSDIMSDDLNDDASNCSKNFNNTENSIDGGGEEEDEETEVPNNKLLSESETCKDLGTEVPNDEVEEEEEEELHNNDSVENENHDLEGDKDDFKEDGQEEVASEEEMEVEKCELDENATKEDKAVEEQGGDPLDETEQMEVEELDSESNHAKSPENKVISGAESDEDDDKGVDDRYELDGDGDRDSDLNNVDSKDVDLKTEKNTESSDSANHVDGSKDPEDSCNDDDNFESEDKNNKGEGSGLDKSLEVSKEEKHKNPDSLNIEEISNDSQKSLKNDSLEGRSEKANKEEKSDEKDEENDTSDSKCGDGENDKSDSRGGDGESDTLDSKGGDGENDVSDSKGGDGENDTLDSKGGDGENDASDSKDGGSPGKVKKARKSAALLNVTPRRSSRNLSKTQKSYAEKEEDPDIEEITPEDPLADPLLNTDPFRDDKENSKTRNSRKTTIVVNDTKRLVEIATGAKNIKGGKKEPTLVIIDTNSILSGRGPVPVSAPPPMTPVPSPSSSGYSVLPVAVPAQGMYPSHTSIHIKSPVVQAPPPPPPPPKPPQILPTLTDDMYVVEAPSFIVPYVYEKPPLKPLKEFLEKLGKEIAEAKDKEEKSKNAGKKEVNEKEKSETEPKEKEVKEKEVKEKEVKEKEKEEVESKAEKNKEKEDKHEEDELNNETSEKDKEKTEDKSSTKTDEGDSSQDSSDSKQNKTENEKDVKTKEKDENTEEKASENKAEGEKKDEDKAGPETRSSSTDKDAASAKPEEKPNKPLTYFDNPLGKFFMQIGINLVQEYVQTDLLRSQKRKRDRDGGKGGAVTQFAINSLLKNLELSKENNEPFHLEQKKCEYCSFKTESSLVMAQHLETPHMRNYVYRCNFCPLEVRSPHDILFHMEAEHNVRGRLERAPAFHQCPNCPFEDNQKGKLTRHLLSCAKKHKPDRNQEPPPDWEPPAKIPRVSRSRPASLGLGAAAYQAMAKQAGPQHHPLLPKLVPAPSLQAPGMGRGRGRPPIHARYMPDMKVPQQRGVVPQNIRGGNMMYRPNVPTTQPQMLLPTTYQIAGNQIYQVVGSQGQMMPMVPSGLSSVSRLAVMPQSSASSGTPPTPVALVPNIAAGNNSITIQSANNKNPTAKLLQQPSISITPLPRQPSGMAPGNPGHNKHGNVQGGKATFVICEICDGYIKDLEQLRNHMQWIHKVKIHPKMIYNRPPLNCQKCQFRFFTDQGLERHLLGSHGLVTSSMQEAANKGKDGGRCPVCGRVYQWKLLNHVARDHNMTLKPAHLSYKCTVCTATFGMYKQFENHVYSAHSVVAKRVMDKKTPQAPRPPQQNDTILKPLKINDEITIIPQPARPRPGPASRTGAISAMMQEKNPPSKVHYCENCEATFDGPTGFSQYVSHIKRRHLRRCGVKVCRLDGCPTCKEKHVTEEMLDFLEEQKEGVDVIELSDDEVVIGQGRNEITITKVSCAPGPRRFKQRLQQSHNVQVIELEDSPVKSSNNTESKENGEDSLTAVKERLRRRKSLEISQVDSECSSPQSSEDGPAKKKQRVDDD